MNFNDQLSRTELRELIPQPTGLVLDKELDVLDKHCQSLIARSPFLLVATSSQDGRCDVSPRGDAPGFVQILDQKRLAIPDRPGNRRLDTIENILDNPQIGLLFVIPGMRETLRVNGKACITRDSKILDKGTVDGKRPMLAIGVEVEEAFIHCAKAFIRSNLWKAETWPDMRDLPSIAQMLIDHANYKKVTTNQSERDLDDELEHDYKTELY